VYIEYLAVAMNMKAIFCDFSASVTSFLGTFRIYCGGGGGFDSESLSKINTPPLEFPSKVSTPLGNPVKS